MRARRIALIAACTTALVIVPSYEALAFPAPESAVNITAKPKPKPKVHRDLYRGTPRQAKAEARYQARRYGWTSSHQFSCLSSLWDHESGWHWNSNNGDGMRTWGIPQSYPGYKMASAGRNWETNVTTQIRWGLRYISKSYGSPCNAWSRWQDRAASGRYGWY